MPQSLILLMAAIAIAPIAIGSAMLPAARDAKAPARLALSGALPAILLCALAFNLSFFWQELGLVIPKALAPGLQPILYHNDHGWTGSNPIAELLQGSGAIATLASGLIFLVLAGGRAPAAWRPFCFWMAFQGLFQALTQLAIGTILPGNDVGRALTYLQFGEAARMALLLPAVVAMAAAGAALARIAPAPGGGDGHDRRFAAWVLIVVVAAILPIIPFRLPRHPIEVALIPLIVNLTGAAWLVLGAALRRRTAPPAAMPSAGPAIPALALVLLLAFFQLVLRPGIAF
ncbi:hypothetical protein [Sphingomonas colocasiae]|uniref:NADH:quinone oxidoreductase/Mrp antiporter membrane subunit domain-containing protein n=1 Tax=Sphingomonas colocasiae TaxID=1848973 RepID=A0ABS7PY16_9SPHN|nr:hypothetical protein [Sphingomonas colocasiae]MBY8826191.1 hypothetical protein [Sphingomonas colocasiae]